MQTNAWYDSFLRLNATAIATQTWNKYNSALNKQNNYCEQTNQRYTWPLPEKLLCGFTLWALHGEELSSDTVKAYIHGLSHIQKFQGFQGISITKSPALPYLLTGAKHGSSPRPRELPKRQPITLHKMLLLRRAILNTTWKRYNKIAVWTCALVTFFGSFRLGELLGRHPEHYDSTSTLLGRHLTYCKNTHTWRIWIQAPKHKCIPRGRDYFVSNP